MSIPLSPSDVGKPPVEPDEVRAITAKMDEQRRKDSSLGNVKRIIGVHSGKGGVGKTFLAVNIAYALAAHGHSIGLLDADVDCPNVPAFLRMTQRLYVKDKRFQPATHHGVKIVSMGMTRDDATEPFLVRGPAKHRVAIDLLTNTDWGTLDFLIVDLPPGTSDVPMSLLEFGELQGVVYVTTPQKEAIVDTQKSVRMGKMFGVHIIGVLENMSGGVFGSGNVEPIAAGLQIPFLGSIPLSERIFALNERAEIALLDGELLQGVALLLESIETVPERVVKGEIEKGEDI